MSKTRTTRSTKSKKSSRAAQSMSSSVLGTIAANESSSSDVVAKSVLALVAPEETVASASSPATMDVAEPAPSNEVEVATTAPSHDDVAKRAYEIFLRRGGRDGHPLADWLQAERELGVVRAA